MREALLHCSSGPCRLNATLSGLLQNLVISETGNVVFYTGMNCIGNDTVPTNIDVLFQTSSVFAVYKLSVKIKWEIVCVLLQFHSVQTRLNNLDINTPSYICDIKFPFPASAEELLHHLKPGFSLLVASISVSTKGVLWQSYSASYNLLHSKL